MPAVPASRSLGPAGHGSPAWFASGLALEGLKIHLPSSGIRLRDPQHRRLLAEYAARAEQERRPILIHLVPVESEASAEEARSFVEEVVRPHPELELYLAHLGGNGGYRISAQRVVEAILAFYAESGEHAQRPIHFELSAALLTRRTDGVPASSSHEIQALARDLRRLGLERVVFGSDYPVFDPVEYARALREQLPPSLLRNSRRFWRTVGRCCCGRVGRTRKRVTQPQSNRLPPASVGGMQRWIDEGTRVDDDSKKMRKRDAMDRIAKVQKILRRWDPIGGRSRACPGLDPGRVVRNEG
jgi:hypothetical protein